MRGSMVDGSAGRGDKGGIGTSWDDIGPSFMGESSRTGVDSDGRGGGGRKVTNYASLHHALTQVMSCCISLYKTKSVSVNLKGGGGRRTWYQTTMVIQCDPALSICFFSRL